MKYQVKNTLAIYWKYCLKSKLSGLLVVIGVTFASIGTVIIPIFYKFLFDNLAQGVNDRSIQAIYSNLAIIACLHFITWLFWRLATFSANSFESHVMTDLVNHCFEYLQLHSYSFFSNNFVGSLVKKVKWFGKSFETIVDRFFWNIIPMIVNILIICAVLAVRNFYLFLAVGLWSGFFLLINYFFTRYKLRFDLQRSQAETLTTGYLADTITNNTTLRLFNGYRREVLEFKKISDKLRRLRKLTWDLDTIFEAVQGFLMVALEVLIIFLAINLWRKNLITIGDFVLIQSYLITIFHRVWEFGRVVRQFYEAFADAAEMVEILEEPHDIKDIPGAKRMVVSRGKIEFKNVDFCYNQTRNVISGLNLIIPSRQHIAIIGASGGGKTTITRLILRLYQVTAGEILIDGQNINRVTQESLWQSISLVPQDPILFHRTLLDNIRYGRPQATKNEVIKAAKAAHCHEFIKDFEFGYETHVGERGVKLSGGERQRVAIARAILRNSPILILDEATSSLDSESEMLIQDALKTLMNGKTVIVIAHRLSTIRQMNRIVVIENGIIMEDGSHDSLLKKKKGIYKNLWSLQAGGFI